tara:strand:- start:30 stop:1400 length:1371 start_codon:yes stop_codon:yes gene_type:complete
MKLKKMKFYIINLIVIVTIKFLSFDVRSQDLFFTLSKTYSTSPLLKSYRLKLEAIDEEISKAQSSKRPKINLYGTIGTDSTTTVNTSNIESTKNNNPKSVSIELSQNIYDSGRTKFNLSKNEVLIYAERANLLNQEQQILLNATEVYFDLLASIEIGKLANNNLQVLDKHYKATVSRYEIGEATSTDLAYSEARFLKAKSDEIRARSEVEINKSKYFSIVGIEPPKILNFPEKSINLPESRKELIEKTLKGNPLIIQQGFIKKSTFFDLSSAFSELLPTLDLNISAQNAWAPNTFFDEYENYKMEFKLKIPLYNGGNNYSNVRQKKKQALQNSKDLDNTIRKELRETEILWFNLNSLISQILSINSTIKASKMALDGVKKETEVGTRTLLDVLDAEQELLEEKVEIVKATRDKFFTIFALLTKIGKLNAKSLDLSVENYDTTRNYMAVKNMWLGFE